MIVIILIRLEKNKINWSLEVINMLYVWVYCGFCGYLIFEICSFVCEYVYDIFK